LNRYEFDMDLEQAVAAPRFHHQWLPDAIWSEEGTFDRGLRGRLQRMGHELRDLKPYKSSAQCIEIVSDSLLIGVSDPRTQGGAASFATDAR
jgi:gamma-glutamyltranspeptidase/glutathione hydrolase